MNEETNGCDPRIAADAATFTACALIALALAVSLAIAGIIEAATERSMVIPYFSAVGILGVLALVAFRGRKGGAK